MLGYTLKHVLDVLPEALPMVKQASITKEFPVDNPDSCLASALSIEYLKAADPGKATSMPPGALEKVAMAVEAYGLTQTFSTLKQSLLDSLTGSMQKQASVNRDGDYKTREAYFLGQLGGMKDVLELTKSASALYEEAQASGITPCDEVCVYSGHAFLSKEAAVTALGHRYQLTKDSVFLKLAAAMSQEPELMPSSRTVKSLCSTVSGMDKKAGLHAQGFDFYKETLLTKSAALSCSSVSLMGESVPLEKILRLPRDQVEHYLGKDIAEGLASDPVTAKAVVDSLPNDMKVVLKTMLKSC
jgi:hypothetical protein